MYVTINEKKEEMNLKENKEGYEEMLAGRKGK